MKKLNYSFGKKGLGLIIKTLSGCLLLSLHTGCCKNCVNQANANVNYPTKTRTGARYFTSEADLSRMAWWERLHDQELSRLIKLALANNNQIKSAKATVKQARAQLKEAQFAWIPTLMGSANGFTGGTWNTNIVPSGSLANSPLFSNISNLRFRGYFSGFVPQYSVNILNNIYNIKSAKANLAMQQAQAEATKLSIISQMSGSYFMLLSQSEQLKLERTLVKDLRELQHLEQVRYRDGASDIETVTTLDQQIAQEDVHVPQIETVIAQTENTIRLLLNENPGPVGTDRTLMGLRTYHLIPANLPSSVLKNRPDIILAANNLKVACAQMGIAYSAFFPNISITSLFGRASLDLTNFLNLHSSLWLAQGNATMNLLNASAYANVKAAKASFEATYYEYMQTLRSAFKDVDDNLINEQNSQIAYEQAHKAYTAAKTFYNVASTQYQKGGKDYRTVVNAKVNLDRAKLSLVQQKAQLLDSVVQVYTAVAGGYAVEEVMMTK